jgi:hypothetical protein
MTETTTERDLLVKFREACIKEDEAERTFDAAKKERQDAEDALIESLQARNADATARYEGLGYARLSKPKLYASFKKEFEPQVFDFLKAEGRSDLIKETVHPSSLSGFVGEKVMAGDAMPPFITYYMKMSARIYPAK